MRDDFKTLATLEKLYKLINAVNEDKISKADAVVLINNFKAEELENIKRLATPIKGVDYFDGEKGERGERGEKGDKGDRGESVTGINGKDGLTPKKGIDYFTDEEVSSIVAEAVKKIPKPKDGITEVVYKKLEFTAKDYESLVKRLEKLPQEKRLDALKLKNIAQAVARYAVNITPAETDPVWNSEKANYLRTDGGTFTGTYTATGDATWFDDIRVEPTARTTGPKAPVYTSYTGGIFVYIFDDAALSSEKEVNFKLQLPHGYKEGSEIDVHVHWTPITTSGAGEKVRWGLEYTKATIGGTFGSPVTIYTDEVINALSSTTLNQNRHLISAFPNIDGTGLKISSILLCRLFRNSSAAEDTFTGSAGLLYIDCHIEHDQWGSNTEFIK